MRAFLFLLLAGPSLFSRIFFLYQQNPKEKRDSKGFYYGLLQDLTLATFFIAMISLTSSSSFFIKILILLFAALVQVDVLVDGFMYQNTCLRLEAPFLVFIKDLGCFWDSAKEKNLAWMYPLSFALFFLYLSGLCLVDFSPLFPHRRLIVIGFFLLLALLFYSRKKIPRDVAYQVNNIALAQIAWAFSKLLRKLTKKRGLQTLQALLSKQSLSPKNENFTKISSYYPLIKYTEGFYGETHFSIPLEPQEKPHLIFLFLESFRAKDVGNLGGCYGVTPNFDSLSNEGILFSNFYANSVKTSRAVSSSLFGIPSDITSSERSSSPDRGFISLAHLLEKKGYHTAYIHNGMLEFENQHLFFPHYGYQTILGRSEILEKYPKAALTSWGVHDEYLMDYAIHWMETQKNSKNPLFLTLFTISNHHPWSAPPGLSNIKLPHDLDPRYARFLKTMHYTDQQLGRFVHALKASGLSKNSIIFIMGDHGHPMGEHAHNFIEQRYLYEENIHVPLLILADGKIEQPKIVDQLGSQMDLLPTVMDVLQMKGFNHAMGSSMLRKGERQLFFHNPYSYGFYGTRKDDEKVIFTKSSNRAELFHLKKDPMESFNKASEEKEKVISYLKDIQDYETLYSMVYENALFSPPQRKNFISKKIYAFTHREHSVEKKPLDLDLSYCDLLNDQTLTQILKRHPDIHTLNIASCKLLTRASLDQITKICSQLKEINLSGCKFEEQDIASFLKECGKLEKVII